MKSRHFLFITIGFLVISCGGSDGVNSEPSVPALLYPTNDLLCIENVLEFRWDASSDAEGDGITYRIEVSSDDGFSNIIHTDFLEDTSRTFTLEKGRTFYWRVLAEDDAQNQSGFSASWRFYTETELVQNALPTVPELLNPSLGSSLDTSEINLEWEANDPDVGDTLVFDLYFGTAEDPPLFETDLSTSSFTVSLDPTTIYYWKVVVKDSNGGVTLGPIWTFESN
ncbi:hypothetical protein [Flagellimonas sp.]|uniref:hypothetical protein n=1 Tax=Flagellimonas sp. TaxID=2058762 RepID=UPI003BAE2A36